MKTSLWGGLVCLLTIGALTSCGKRPQEAESKPPPPSETALKLAPTPTPAPEAKPTPEITSARKRLAPEGVLYLTKRATITSEFGITGVSVGAEVKILEPEKDGITAVEYRGNKLVLPSSQLTNDLDVVDSLARQTASPAVSRPQPMTSAAASATPDQKLVAAQFEAQRQANLRETRAKQFEAAIQLAEKRIRELEQEMEVSIRMGNRAYVNGQVVANNNIENRGRRDQIETLRQQISAWRNEISSLRR